MAAPTSSTGLEVDDDLCVGSGNCEFLAPATFRVGDDGISRVLAENDSDPALIERAIAECPTAAIRRVAAGHRNR